jgi:hypothetical protein
LRESPEYNVRIDATVPTGSIVINSGSAWTSSPSVTLSLTYSDGSGSGVNQVRYSNDGSTWSAWESPSATKVWTLASGDGTKTVNMQTKDTMGNLGLIAYDEIILNTVSSMTTLTSSGILSGTNLFSSNVQISLSATGTFPIQEIKYRINGGIWNTYVSSFIASNEGTTTVDYYSINSLGNQESIKTFIFTIDKTPVTTMVGTGTGYLPFCYNTNVLISFNVVVHDVTVQSTMYRINGGTWNQYSVPFNLVTDGTYVIDYYSTTVARIESSKTNTIRIDRTNPTKSTILSVSADYHQAILQWTTDSSACEYRVYANGVLKATTASGGITIYSLVSGAPYWWKIRSVDASGNYMDSNEYLRWTLALPPPPCFIEGTKVATLSGEINIEDIIIGDTIWSYNWATGTKELSTVVNTFEHLESSYLLINDLGVTENHPMYVNGNIRLATDIRVGDTLDGFESQIIVTHIEKITLENEVLVYNLEVENNHNYYAEGALVHNKVWPPSCPYLYVWNGTDYVKDNSLLTMSEDATVPESEIIDYYALQVNAVPVDEVYKLRILEGELYETSHIDTVELITVDYNGDFNIGVTQDGEFLTYQNPMPPITCIDENGTNILPLIENIDDNHFDGYNGDSLIMTFEYEPNQSAKLVMRTDLKCTAPPIVPWDEVAPGGLYGPIIISILNGNNEWVEAGRVVPRELWGTDIFDLSPFISQYGSSLIINLTWTSHHWLDYVGLDQSENGDVEVSSQSLASATLWNGQDVFNTLSQADEDYLVLVQGEFVDFEFPYVPSQSQHRELILCAKGFYEITLDYLEINDIDVYQNVSVSATSNGTPGNSFELYFIDSNDNTVTPRGNINIACPETETISLHSAVDGTHLLVIRNINTEEGNNTLTLTLEADDLIKTLTYEFSSVNGETQEIIVNIDEIFTELFNSGNTIYYAPTIIKNGLIQPESLTWDFGTGQIFIFNDTMEREFPFMAPGTYSIDQYWYCTRM